MASYKRGVAYIALNDEPSYQNVADMVGFASVHVLAEVFDKDEREVAVDVIRFRMKMQQQEDRMQSPEHDYAEGN